MNESIIESGMHFDNTDAWAIEKSELYSTLNKGNKSLKTVEFIRAKRGNYVFVEAKHSFPNLHNPAGKDDAESNITDILSKFMHSLSILSSVLLNVNLPNEIPEAFYQRYHPKIHFVLIINFSNKNVNDYQTRSICEEIRNVFNDRLSKELKHIWGAKVWVLNKTQAIQRGFVLADNV